MMTSRQRLFLKRFREGYPPTKAAALVGATWADVCVWYRRNHDFAADYRTIDPSTPA